MTIENVSWPIRSKKNKNICCGYSLEAPCRRLYEMLLMSSLIICYWEMRKNSIFIVKTYFFVMGTQTMPFRNTSYDYPKCIFFVGKKNVYILANLQSDQSTVKPQWVEHGYLVYHGWFKLIFESLRNFSDSSRKRIFRVILRIFSYFIMKMYVVCSH